MLVGLQERFLHRVFGIFAILGDVLGETEDFAFVAADSVSKAEISPAFAAATSADSSSLTTVEGNGSGRTGSSLGELIENLSIQKRSIAFDVLLAGMYYHSGRPRDMRTLPIICAKE